MTEDTEPRRDLAGSVILGVGWTAASQGAIQLSGFVTAVVIARFLTPFEVGLAAEALVFATLALVIVDLGLASALVQRETISEDDKSTVFWAGTGIGVGLTLVGVALSWPIADLYGEPRVQPLFAVLSLAFLFTGPGVVQEAMLVRNLEFRSLEVRTIVATLACCATAMTLAVLGFGPWAIVAQTLVMSSVSTALLWYASEWRPQARFSLASLRSIAAHTGNVFGTQALAWGTVNLDNFLIGRFVGASALGAYTIAFSVIVAPVKRIATPLTQVFFPAFSRIRDRERIAGLWLRASRMVALVTVPVMLGLIAVAPDFVVALFGDQWDEAIPVVQILAPVGLLQSLTALNMGILQSLDLTRPLFRFSLVLSIATVAAFAVGIPWGIVGVSTGYLVITVLMQPLFVGLTARVVGLTLRDWLRSIAGIVQAGIAMSLVVFGARELLVEASVPVGLRLALLIAVGALTYALLVAWREPEVGREIRALRDRRRRSPGDGLDVPT